MLRKKSSKTSWGSAVLGGAFGSDVRGDGGSAPVATARTVVKKALDLAAKDLEVAPADVEFGEGRFSVKGTDLGVTFQEVSRRYHRELDTVDGVPAPMSFPGGAHVAEVEIDPDTGVIDIVNYVAVDDCGRVINHVLLEGPTFRAIVQGIGQVLMEHCVYDETGQLLTGSFLDYAMPTPDILTGAKIDQHCVPSPTKLLRSKGDGEAVTTGDIPTYTHAVNRT